MYLIITIPDPPDPPLPALGPAPSLPLAPPPPPLLVVPFSALPPGVGDFDPYEYPPVPQGLFKGGCAPLEKGGLPEVQPEPPPPPEYATGLAEIL